MKEIQIILEGEMTKYHLFDILNAKLDFTYAQPNWDSMIEALGTLDWLKKETKVFLIIKENVSICKIIGTPDKEETDIFYESLIIAYRRNLKLPRQRSKRYLQLKFE